MQLKPKTPPVKSGMPFDLDEPGDAQPTDQGDAKADGAIPGYLEAYQRCSNCEHFDGEGHCKKYDAPADMDATCPAFEEKDQGGDAEESDEDRQPARVTG